VDFLSRTTFEGGKVIEPIRGEHKNVFVLDVASLYPTMIINYNISFDTVNCSCCKDDLSARVPKYIISVRDYWICRKAKGVFTELMGHFTSERLRQQKIGNETQSQGLKILINSGYGVFGYRFFKHYNRDVAILVAAYGRYVLTKMQEMASADATDNNNIYNCSQQQYRFRVVNGDTDSLFLVAGNNNSNDDITANEQEKEEVIQQGIKLFIKDCNEKLHIEVKHEKTFAKCLISKKKHYIGILEDLSKDPIIKGFEGIKSDRVEWVRKAFFEMVQDYQCDRDPITKLRNAFSDLEQWNIRDPEHLLLKTIRLRQDPEDYKNNCLQKKIGLELGLTHGDTVPYYLADNNKGYTFNVNELSISQYKKMLLHTVKDVLEILGYDIDQELFGKVSLSSFI
jgi:DNA polymerase, archaea type